MTADEYVPSEEEVREEYIYGAQDVDLDGHVVVSFDEACARWDRFLARIRRDAAREALDGLAEHIDWTASQFLGVRVGSQKAQDVRDYRDEHYPEETDR